MGDVLEVKNSQNQLIDGFVQLISNTLGLSVQPQMHQPLWQHVLLRVKVLHLNSPTVYYQWLASHCHIPTEDPEWREFINLLSITESYFFRDQGQFLLLKHRLLPELIQRKRAIGRSQAQTLRVWSAGCSTGEEAYSLAILIKELIPPDEDWKISIIGTDINQAAVEQARQGLYSNWSFRLVSPEVQKTYFQPHRRGWEIDPTIRQMVNFHVKNLVPDSKPLPPGDIPNLHALDLIVCRNVFIYFSASAIAQVLAAFHHALAPGGYLLTGHTELYSQQSIPFKTRAFPESIAYQREIHPVPTPTAQPLRPAASSPNSTPPLALSPAAAPEIIPPPARIHSLDSKPRSTPALSNKLEQARVQNQATTPTDSNTKKLSEIIQLIDQKAYSEAIGKAKQLIAQNNQQQLQLYCLLAEVYANLGDYADAIEACHQALRFDPLTADPLYILAQISQEQGDLESAKGFLRRVIYLNPMAGYAYFELGCLYEQQGNLDKAQRNWKSTLGVLKQLSPDTPVDWRKGVTVEELCAVVEQKLIN